MYHGNFSEFVAVYVSIVVVTAVFNAIICSNPLYALEQDFQCGTSLKGLHIKDYPLKNFRIFYPVLKKIIRSETITDAYTITLFVNHRQHHFELLPCMQ